MVTVISEEWSHYLFCTVEVHGHSTFDALQGHSITIDSITCLFLQSVACTFITIVRGCESDLQKI
jgi:hypothetical protein